MTEAEWLSCDDPQPMLHFLGGRAGARKLGLFAVACWRRVFDARKDADTIRAADAAELWVDQSARQEQAPVAAADRRTVIGGLASAATRLVAWAAAGSLSNLHRLTEPDGLDERNAADAPSHERIAQAGLLRDLFGNPFRPIALDPTWFAWNDGAIRKMAQVVFDDRGFDRLPLLADALEDAGCTDAAMLAHCRADGEHVRGCWIVDLLLGKS